MNNLSIIIVNKDLCGIIDWYCP